MKDIILYNNEHLKDILFDEFNKFEDYDIIIQDLRSLHSEGELNDDEYSIILENYEEWLKEYENKELEKEVNK